MAEIKNEIAVFGGGCFWCTEAVFKMLKGVQSVMPGYAGGSAEDANYERVSTGETGHCEATRVEFDPTQIDFNDLLTVFFASHDPSSLNRQGNDVGTQYRSAVFYTTPEQKEKTEKMIKEIDATANGKPVVTEVVPLEKFYDAEDYHRDYYAKNKDKSYCQLVINPKLKKVKEHFAELLAKA
jgi:peptide-methionine (S)-S-oxide reductase